MYFQPLKRKVSLDRDVSVKTFSTLVPTVITSACTKTPNVKPVGDSCQPSDSEHWKHRLCSSSISLLPGFCHFYFCAFALTKISQLACHSFGFWIIRFKFKFWPWLLFAAITLRFFLLDEEPVQLSYGFLSPSGWQLRSCCCCFAIQAKYNIIILAAWLLSQSHSYHSTF